LILLYTTTTTTTATTATSLNSYMQRAYLMYIFIIELRKLPEKNRCESNESVERKTKIN